MSQRLRNRRSHAMQKRSFRAICTSRHRVLRQVTASVTRRAPAPAPRRAARTRTKWLRSAGFEGIDPRAHVRDAPGARSRVSLATLQVLHWACELPQPRTFQDARLLAADGDHVRLLVARTNAAAQRALLLHLCQRSLRRRPRSPRRPDTAPAPAADQPHRPTAVRLLRQVLAAAAFGALVGLWLRAGRVPPTTLAILLLLIIAGVEPNPGPPPPPTRSQTSRAAAAAARTVASAPPSAAATRSNALQTLVSAGLRSGAKFNAPTAAPPSAQPVPHPPAAVPHPAP